MSDPSVVSRVHNRPLRRREQVWIGSAGAVSDALFSTESNATTLCSGAAAGRCGCAMEVETWDEGSLVEKVFHKAGGGN